MAGTGLKGCYTKSTQKQMRLLYKIRTIRQKKKGEKDMKK